MHELEKRKTENRTQNAERRRHKGLSIIEVAMASALLIIAMVPILRSLTKANMYSAEVETKTQSLILAQGKLDELRAMTVHDFNSLNSPDTTLPDASYFCNVSVTATTNPDLKQVTVSVGPSGGGVEAALATYFARRQ
jgi:Tfp pilus assembly protein PilV